MSIPNLAGVIKKDDVFRKGTGSYAADYVSWARIANHLHTNAPEWEFALREAPEGGHVWKAPDGTGYVVSYFIGPDRQFTPDFVFPCQDNRNQPIPFEKVSCRTLTDTHRRALCANAAFTFSLGYELWAKEEVEAATSSEPAPTPAKPKAKAEPKPEPAADPADQPLTQDDRKLILALMKDLPTDKLQPILNRFREAFSLPADAKVSAHITTQAHAAMLRSALEAA
jgi:hypothetical protein